MRIFALVAITFLLAGCAPTEPVVTPVPTPSTTPLFATDADALKAAEDAYAAYLKVSDQILRDGGADPDRIDAVATPKWAKAQKVGYEQSQRRGWRSIGSTAFGGALLESYSADSEDESVVIAYFCVDVSRIDVLDGDGNSVVSPDRPARAAFEVSFGMSESKNTVVVSKEDPWSGSGIC